MAATQNLKQARVHLRLDFKTKRKLERAAAYAETTMSAFVLGNAVAAADRVIESHEQVVLATLDWDVLHNALLDPPEPNATLQNAAKRYRRRVGG
ncbi:MAG: DUF1778 domain-containing protein [Gammaproteobacteria bacterium]|nr:DUF1778 domain-containing protein [Gammaproteobacteria bacterium]